MVLGRFELALSAANVAGRENSSGEDNGSSRNNIRNAFDEEQ